MNREWLRRWQTYVVVLPVTLAICVAFWISALATYENHRFGQAVDQMIEVVLQARAMKLSPNLPSDRALIELASRMTGARGVLIKEVAGGAGGGSAYGYEDSWQNMVRIQIAPSTRLIRFDMGLTPPMCRRFLLFYAEEAGALGLANVAVRDVGPASTWRLVYESSQPQSDKKIHEEGIYSGCGRGELVELSMAFFLAL